MDHVNQLVKPVSLKIFLCLASGIFLGSLLVNAKVFLLFSFLVIWIAFVFARPFRATLFFILVFISGGILIQHARYPQYPDHHIVHFAGKKKIQINGTVVSFVRQYDHKYRAIVACHSIEDPKGQPRKTHGRIMLTVYSTRHPVFTIYDDIAFTAKIKLFRNFNNPGGFNYKRFMSDRSVAGSCYSNDDQLIVFPTKKNVFLKWLQSIESLRNRFSSFVLTRQDSPAARIFLSMITGKRELIDNHVRDAFSKTGISHLLAISGLHLSIVGSLFFLFMYHAMFLFCFFLKKMRLFKTNTWIESGRIKKAALFSTLIPLSFYAVFAGFSPSTQRAFIMTIVFLAAFMFDRKTDVLSNLFIAGILILLLDSTALFTISFQLSFMAVLFICLGLSILKKINAGLRYRWMHKIAVLVWVTICAGAGTLGLSAYYFHVIALAQIPVNLFAIPIIGGLVLPGGFLSLAGFGFLPDVSAAIIEWCCAAIAMIVSMSHTIASMPYTWVRVARLHVIEVIGLYLFASGCLLWCHSRLKKASRVFFIVSACCMVSGLAIRHNSSLPDDTVSVTAIDVGQGLSALIQMPENINMLVDGGGFSSRSTFDPGRFIVAPFLWHSQVHHLDYVILSHPEGDHLNGLIYVLENFKVARLIKNRDKNHSVTYKRMMDLCRQKNIIILHPEELDPGLRIGPVQLDFLNATIQGSDLNNNSIVFKLTYNAFSILFPGDIMKQREHRLSQTYPDQLKSTILIAPHHGSATSSQKIFLEKVQANSVIVSCGWQNRYGFPHIPVLKRYAGLGMSVYRTDTHGAIQITSNGRSYEMHTCKDN
jgi:competence protein ComEC